MAGEWSTPTKPPGVEPQDNTYLTSTNSLDGLGGSGITTRKKAMQKVIAARTEYSTMRDPVRNPIRGENAPEIPNAMVFAPSQGPAAEPCSLRVMIWLPALITAVRKPMAAKLSWSMPTSPTRGMHMRVPASRNRAMETTILPGIPR